MGPMRHPVREIKGVHKPKTIALMIFEFLNNDGSANWDNHLTTMGLNMFHREIYQLRLATMLSGITKNGGDTVRHSWQLITPTLQHQALLRCKPWELHDAWCGKCLEWSRHVGPTRKTSKSYDGSQYCLEQYLQITTFALDPKRIRAWYRHPCRW